LIEVQDAEILKGALSLEQVVAGDEQSMTDGDNGPLATSLRCDSLEEGREVALPGSRETPDARAELLS
jgi:hypothetical protein